MSDVLVVGLALSYPSESKDNFSSFCLSCWLELWVPARCRDELSELGVRRLILLIFTLVMTCYLTLGNLLSSQLDCAAV